MDCIEVIHSFIKFVEEKHPLLQIESVRRVLEDAKLEILGIKQINNNSEISAFSLARVFANTS